MEKSPDHTTPRQKALYAALGELGMIYATVMMGINWLNNPDEKVSISTLPFEEYDCWAAWHPGHPYIAG